MAKKEPAQILIDPDYCGELVSVGMTTQQVCDIVGISTRTFHAEYRKSPEFKKAIDKGRALGISKVASQLFKDAIEGNTTAQIFFLKTRGYWSDKQIEGDASPKLEIIIHGGLE